MKLARWVPSTVLAALCACSGEEGTELQLGVDLGTTEQEVFGGAPSIGDGAVGSLNGVGFICSGTLISSKVVATAGHCTDGNNTPSVFFGQQIGGAGKNIPGATHYTSPLYQEDNFSAFDAGVVILKQRANVVIPGLVPHQFRHEPMTDALIGQNVRFVGFGDKGDGETGQKFTVSAAIDSISPTYFQYGPAICQGDSGGPAFERVDNQDVLVGITSFGLGQGCGVSGGSARVDYFATWFDEVIAEEDPPSCEADFRCPGNCDATDPDCPCAEDGFCDALCEDTESDPDCPRGCGANDVCVSGPQCPHPDPDCGDPCGAEGHCIESCDTRDTDCAEAAGPASACARDFDCGAGACVFNPSTARKECFAACDGGDCDDGGKCQTLTPGGPAACYYEDGGEFTSPVSLGSGGCAVTPRGAGGGAAWLLALVALGAVRLRRRD